MDIEVTKEVTVTLSLTGGEFTLLRNIVDYYVKDNSLHMLPSGTSNDASDLQHDLHSVVIE